jgi:hypothetical protein
MKDDLSPEDLMQIWNFQDNIQNMAQQLLSRGIDLGVQATTLTLAEKRLSQTLDLDDPEFYNKLTADATLKAKTELERRLDARGTDTE